MPKLKVKTGRVSLPGGGGALLVTLDGFIDAQNYDTFDGVLRKLDKDHEKNVVLDFQGVEYINSSGIGAVIQHHHRCEEAGGRLILAAVSHQVGLTMRLLGVSNFVPFVDTQQDAVAFFRGEKPLPTPPPPPTPSAPLRARGGAATPPVGLDRRVANKPSDSSILIVAPQSDVFTDILKLRLHDPNGRFTISHSTQEALDIFDRLHPDLVVLDHAMPGAEDFLYAVKIQKGRSLVSIIKLYGRPEEIEKVKDFKIWENDYLIEPFEIMALFALAEAELRRVPDDREQMLHQVHFQFRTTDRNLEKAQDLARNLIEQVELREDDRVAIFAAFKEAMDNAAFHGNRNDPAKSVDVHFILGRDKVTMVIEDEGDGFDYLSVLAQREGGQAFEQAKDRIIRDGQRGGLGILLIKKCVDFMEYSGRGNVLRMEKQVIQSGNGSGS